MLKIVWQNYMHYYTVIELNEKKKQIVFSVCVDHEKKTTN